MATTLFGAQVQQTVGIHKTFYFPYGTGGAFSWEILKLRCRFDVQAPTMKLMSVRQLQ